MPTNESKIPVGTVLVGKYRVVREIGRGGMAAVYEAEQLSLGKKVAVKVLAAELSASTIVIERFFREARAAASVKSPYIVDVYDSGRLDDGRPFIAMELLEGESLYDRMARVRIIDVETTVRVIVHSAKGLMKAHAAGIVHRDLKPENIFLTKGEDGEEVCKILDFGLAKFYAPVNPEDKSQKRLTREGAVFGTPAYMSPEQVKGQGSVDHRADLWALGCMAFECLIGRPVWNMDQGVAMTFAAIATGNVPVPSQIRRDLPPKFDAWFLKCLERDPGHRYQSAKELSDAFIDAWGRPPSSNASFPSVALPGSGAYAPRVSPAEASLEASQVPGQIPAPTTDRSGAPLPGVPAASPSARVAPFGGNGRASVGSDPLPLVQHASADVPGLTDTSREPAKRAASPVRVALSATLLAGSVAAAIVVWVRFLNPQVFTPVVESTATTLASAAPSGSYGASTTRPDEPKWAPTIAEGQRLFTAGNLDEARKKFQEAIEMGGDAATVGKVYDEQAKVVAKDDGACKPVAFVRPRISTSRRAERPSIVATSKGALVTWTDDHEQKGKAHVYGVMVDPTGKPLGPVRDLTPEAANAEHPQLVSKSADRSVLLYWDSKGRDAGVRVRFLDAEGRIDMSKGQSVLVGAARAGSYWPSIARGPQGFWVAWQDDRDRDGDNDLFVRQLSNELDTVGPETRVTDYVVPHKSKLDAPTVRYPSVAIAANQLLVAYRLEDDKEKTRRVVRLRVPLDVVTKGGIEELPKEAADDKPTKGKKDDDGPKDRVLGDVAPVSDEKRAGAPAVACGTEGCFVVWDGDPRGAYVALIDPKEGMAVWHKKFSSRGGHPMIAVNQGRVAVAFYEAGRIKLAFLSRDGVSKPSTLLRVYDTSNPRPSLTAGAKDDEWLIAWQDSDTARGASEVYAARVLCQ